MYNVSTLNAVQDPMCIFVTNRITQPYAASLLQLNIMGTRVVTICTLPIVSIKLHNLYKIATSKCYLFIQILKSKTQNTHICLNLKPTVTFQTCSQKHQDDLQQ